YIGFFLYKYVRLLPTVFLACIFQLGVMYVFYKINGAGLFGGFYPVSDVIATLLLVQYGYIARPTAVNAAVWYLCVLVQCYLIYCLIQFVCEKSGGKIKVWHLYAVTVFLSLMSDFLVPKSLYLPFLNDTSSRGITTFFTGALIYMLQKSDKKMLLRALRVISVCLCIPAYFLLYRSVYVLMFMAYPLLVDAASSAKQLGGKVFAFLGDITLDMYLWHIPMIYLFFAILLTMGLISLDTVFMLCAVVVITIIFAAVYNVLAEKPMQRAIKNLFAANTREAEKDAI
ncbi:MAG: acyltransferase, partial [Firmicutes bacterium]|nr:acyltransferase [Bacillota bacterium]